MTLEVQADSRTKKSIQQATQMIAAGKGIEGEALGAKEASPLFYHHNGGPLRALYDGLNTAVSIAFPKQFPTGINDDLGLTYLGGYSMIITPTSIGAHCAALSIKATNETTYSSATRNIVTQKSPIPDKFNPTRGPFATVTQNITYTQVVHF